MNNDETKVKMTRQYCGLCGTKLKDETFTSYSEYTGEKNHGLVCAKVGCERSCDFYGHEWKRRFWWASDVKCVKCGYIPRDY